MIGLSKKKYHGFKRLWKENISFFNKNLNDPDETVFDFFIELENGKRRLSGKYKRWLVNFLLKSQKYRADKFSGELNYLFLDIGDILNSKLVVTESREDFREWLKLMTPTFSDWSILEPTSYKEMPQRYKDFFDKEIANKGFLFKCYFFDETIEDATYVFLLASTKELNDDIYQTFFSNQKKTGN